MHVRRENCYDWFFRIEIERFKCFKHLLTPILLNTMSSYQKAQDWISIPYCFTIMLEESYEKPFLSFFTVIVLSSSSSSLLQLLTGSFPFPFVFFSTNLSLFFKGTVGGKTPVSLCHTYPTPHVSWNPCKRCCSSSWTSSFSSPSMFLPV